MTTQGPECPGGIAKVPHPQHFEATLSCAMTAFPGRCGGRATRRRQSDSPGPGRPPDGVLAPNRPPAPQLSLPHPDATGRPELHETGYRSPRTRPRSARAAGSSSRGSRRATSARAGAPAMSSTPALGAMGAIIWHRRRQQVGSSAAHSERRQPVLISWRLGLSHGCSAQSLAAAKPCSRSARMSSMNSIPTASRTRPGVTPDATWSSAESWE